MFLLDMCATGASSCLNKVAKDISQFGVGACREFSPITRQWASRLVAVCLGSGAVSTMPEFGRFSADDIGGKNPCSLAES